MCHPLQARVDEAEQNATKASRKIIAKLEERVRTVEQELDSEQRRHSEQRRRTCAGRSGASRSSASRSADR